MTIHVDMDAFFASVEELDNPDIQGKPVIVGGPSKQRGVVSAANYHAREYGVHSAMPMIAANRLCPDAIVISPRHSRYSEISKSIRAIFYRYTPLVQPLSLDEAFLDVRQSVKLFGSEVQIARRIKSEIQRELNLTASVGVAPNKFLAKLASDAEKPNGFVVVQKPDIQSFLDPMPVNRLWGVGKSSARRLEGMAIYSVRDLRRRSLEDLEKNFGTQFARHLYNLSRGIDNRMVTVDSGVKSISRETTFSNDISNVNEIRRVFVKLTENVCKRMRARQLFTKTIQIKYRRKDFTTFTRSESLIYPTNQTGVIWKKVSDLAEKHIDGDVMPVRLVGVSLSNFSHDGEIQPDLFEPANNTLDALSDKINAKFGNAAVGRAKGLAKTKPKP